MMRIYTIVYVNTLKASSVRSNFLSTTQKSDRKTKLLNVWHHTSDTEGSHQRTSNVVLRRDGCDQCQIKT